MRRVLIVLLAMLLPLQFAWAAAGDEGQTPDQAPHLDGPVCHLAASTAVPSVADLTHAALGATARHAVIRALFRSTPDTLPDRPQWSRLA